MKDEDLPAFPTSKTPLKGMSVREYFACHAMTAIGYRETPASNSKRNSGDRRKNGRLPG